MGFGHIEAFIEGATGHQNIEPAPPKSGEHLRTLTRPKATVIDPGAKARLRQNGKDDVASFNILMEDKDTLISVCLDETEGNLDPLQTQIYDARSPQQEAYNLIRLHAELTCCPGDRACEAIVFLRSVFFELEDDVPHLKRHDDTVPERIPVGIAVDDGTKGRNENLAESAIIGTLSVRPGTN